MIASHTKLERKQKFQQTEEYKNNENQMLFYLFIYFRYTDTLVQLYLENQ
jgi:hypothetical protein